jgi:hypothetical protein
MTAPFVFSGSETHPILRKSAFISMNRLNFATKMNGESAKWH